MATELALLPVHSAVWARHCLGLRRTGPANWLTMSSLLKAALQSLQPFRDVKKIQSDPAAQ